MGRDHLPSVTVIVPALDAERYLADCLASILSQDFADMEVIVVDDGSTDRTAEIATSFAPQVRCHRQDNGGVAAALNAGLALARGAYISFVASDDGLYAAATEAQVSVLEEYEQVGMVHGGAQEIDEAGDTLGYRGAPGGDRVAYYRSKDAVRRLLRGNHVVCSSVMVRRACMERLGGFRQDFVPGEDWEMWLRIAGHYDVAYVDRPLARRRIHDESLTSGFTVEMMAASHERVLRALVDGGVLCDRPDLRSYATACNDRSLAWLAANTRRRSTFARYLVAALRRRPALLIERETWRATVDGAKACLPVSLLDAARRLRHGAEAGA